MAGGDLGIAQDCNKQFVNREISGSTLNARETQNFLNSSGSSTRKPLNSYQKPDGNFNIPENDVDFNNNSRSGGLPALEKTLFQSVFETQKPYLEVSLSVLSCLVLAEDVIAILRGGTNEKSLKTKN